MTPQCANLRSFKIAVERAPGHLDSLKEVDAAGLELEKELIF